MPQNDLRATRKSTQFARVFGLDFLLQLTVAIVVVCSQSGTWHLWTDQSEAVRCNYIGAFVLFAHMIHLLHRLAQEWMQQP